MIFEWKDFYSCNIETFDEQHKKLFKIGYKLDELLQISKGNENLAKDIITVFKELFDYTLYHFKTEEDLMKKTSYENYEKHKRKHAIFTEKISCYNLNTTFKDQNEIISELLSFIGKWIIEHILNTDMEYMTHFEKISIDEIESSEFLVK
jgi:hemerythrin